VTDFEAYIESNSVRQDLEREFRDDLDRNRQIDREIGRIKLYFNNFVKSRQFSALTAGDNEGKKPATTKALHGFTTTITSLTGKHPSDRGAFCEHRSSSVSETVLPSRALGGCQANLLDMATNQPSLPLPFKRLQPTDEQSEINPSLRSHSTYPGVGRLQNGFDDYVDGRLIDNNYFSFIGDRIDDDSSYASLLEEQSGSFTPSDQGFPEESDSRENPILKFNHSEQIGCFGPFDKVLSASSHSRGQTSDYERQECIAPGLLLNKQLSSASSLPEFHTWKSNYGLYLS
jgi:hypothetical protein